MALVKRQIDQWNRIEYPEIDSQKYGQLFFDKEAKAIKWSKIVSSTNGAGIAEYFHAKNKTKQSKKNLDTQLIPFTKIN